MKPHRFEFKYQIDPFTAKSIETEIKKFGMSLDSHATEDDGSYYVTSLYFDSFNKNDFQEKSGGELTRKKIRLRIYEPYLKNSKFGTLEIKHKYDMVNRKTKIVLNRDEMEGFIKHGKIVILKKSDCDKEARENMLRYLNNYLVKPVTLVTYLRRAYVTNSKDLRVTFDHSLKTASQSSLNKNNFLREVNKGGLTMELKYNYSVPFFMRAIIKKYNLKRDTFSKYEKSVEKLDIYNLLLK